MRTAAFGRTLLASVGAFVAGCAGAHSVSAADDAFFRQFERKVFPVTGSGMAQLPPQRRAEIRLIQSVLKPQYRSRLTYTYSTNGIFVVFLSYGDRRTGGGMAINGCSTPRDRALCMHDCGIGFQEQFWTAGALSEDRCQDDAPVWLHPRQPLPKFEAPGKPGASPTP